MSQWDSYLSNAAVPRIKSVDDPIFDIARDPDAVDMCFGGCGRWEYADHIRNGYSNFDFKTG